MPEKQFRTGFLLWTDLGTLWSAPDPTCSEMRWVIRRPMLMTPQREWEVGYVIYGNFYSFCYGKDPKVLGFKAVAKKIDQMANQIEVFSDQIKPEQKPRIYQILDVLNGAFENDQLAPSSSDGCSNVDQEKGQQDSRSAAD